jgi:hypothetical protein
MPRYYAYLFVWFSWLGSYCLAEFVLVVPPPFYSLLSSNWCFGPEIGCKIPVGGWHGIVIIVTNQGPHLPLLLTDRFATPSLSHQHAGWGVFCCLYVTKHYHISHTVNAIACAPDLYCCLQCRAWLVRLRHDERIELLNRIVTFGMLLYLYDDNGYVICLFLRLGTIAWLIRCVLYTNWGWGCKRIVLWYYSEWGKERMGEEAVIVNC